MLQQTLSAGSRTQFTLVGEFIYIDQTPSPLRIQTQRGFYELEKGAQIIDPQANGGQVTVELTGSESGLVRIISGYGRYVPPADGQQVNVGQMPAVQFDGEQPVVLQSLPPVAFDGAQPVSLQRLPRVAFDGAQPVSVQSLPPVVVGTLPQVEVGSLPPVSVHAMPALSIAPNQKVVAQSLSARTVKKTVFEFTDDNPVLVFPENPDRLRVELTSYSNNTGRAYFYPEGAAFNDGFRVDVGKSETFALYGAFVLEGDVGDTILVMEYLV